MVSIVSFATPVVMLLLVLLVLLFDILIITVSIVRIMDIIVPADKDHTRRMSL